MRARHLNRARALLALLFLLLARQAPAASVRVTYRFERPAIDAGKDYHRIEVPGLESWAPAGAPRMPRRLARILLPPGTTAGAVAVRPSAPVWIRGACRIEPAPLEHSPAAGLRGIRRAVPDPAVYDSPNPYPRLPGVVHGVAFKHGFAFLLITLCPATYLPVAGEVLFSESIEVEVALEPLAAPISPILSRAALRDVAGFADNGDAALAHLDGGGVGAGVAGEEVAHAIITSAALAPAFEPLAARRSAGGLPSRVFTTEWIQSNYGGERPGGGSDLATRIRNFITDYHRNHGLRFVLLGGDADGDPGCGAECGPVVVPARYLQSQALFAIPIPSDMYYGCLDGTFDGDEDGIYGEPNDGDGGGDVDFLFEVHVGRAPVDSTEEARNFVRKTLLYEEMGGAVLREVLLAGEYLGFGGEYDWGGNLNDQIRWGTGAGGVATQGFESSSLATFFNVATLYDRDWPNQNWPPEEIVSRLEAGVHLVNHVGHADISNVMKLTNAEIDALSASFPFLAYTQSCYAGAFDNRRTNGEHGADCVAEHFLAGPSGAAAVIANSRQGWASSGIADGPSQRLNRLFWHSVLSMGILRLGAANDRSKEESIGFIAENERGRWCAYELNTLGDPALAIQLGSPRGSVAFDREAYNPGAEARITVIDSGLNADTDAIDEAAVNVKALSTADEESVVLRETGISSAVFEGKVALESGTARSDGRLQAGPPDTLVATYSDADIGNGTSALVEAQARASLPLALAGACPPDGALGVPYRSPLVASGGVPPYRFYSETGYAEVVGPPQFDGLGTGQNWTEDEGAWAYVLPFAFPFYGELFESVVVSANGYIQLGPGNALEFNNTPEGLIRSSRIAPLWADIRTTGGGDIYIEEKSDAVTIRWQGTSYHTQAPVNFEVELFADGSIRFGYGRGNLDLSPTIGISAGDGAQYALSALNAREDLSETTSVLYFPTRLPAGLEVDPVTGDVFGAPREVSEGDVSFRVEDSVGQAARKRCFLGIRPEGLVATAPAAGDLWLAGSEGIVRWQWFGSVGSRVRIDYNTDGSMTAFPFAIAGNVPISAREYPWTTPAQPAPRVRVRVRSLERPEIFSVSELFAITRPALFLVAPNGGERWVTGSRETVRWQRIGDTGARVRVRYNTDGSLTSFPLTLAADAPNTGDLALQVPATVSDTCRARIESVSMPAAFAVSSEVFSIRSPSIEITSPNGGECLRTMSEVAITWSVHGDTGPQVVIEYNTDGTGVLFPFRVGTGALPNTGSATWTVPDAPGPCRLRIRSASNPLIFDVADGPFRLDPRCDLRVLVWVPFIPVEEEQVLGISQALARFEPDAKLEFSTATSPLAFAAALAGKDALVVPRQKRAGGGDFDGLGRDLALPLLEFASRGGAIAVTEQGGDFASFLPGTGLMNPAFAGEGMFLCEVADPIHPIMAGVRPNFAGPRNTGVFRVSDPGVEVLALAAEGLTVVAARDIGFGRVSLLGFDFFSFNDITARILANAVRQPLPAAGIRFVSPAPGEVFRVGEPIPVRWVARGEARGRAALFYTEAGAEPEVEVPIGEAEMAGDAGAFDWTVPDLPAGGLLAARLAVRSIAAPRHVARLEDSVYITRPLRIETSALPGGVVDLEYAAEIHASGGVPPYSFQVNGLPPGLMLQDPGGVQPAIRGVPLDACASCPIEIAVSDAAGDFAIAPLQLTIVVRSLHIVTPRDRELWLYGSPQRISWAITGYVGETVNLRFNTDGSPFEFPFVIAESAPVGQPYDWLLPALTAPSCRMRISSNEFPHIQDLSGVFSIVGPTISLIAPNGGECWEPLKEKRILWRSAGNHGGRVTIELGVDGSEEEFPVLIAEDVEDTGEYPWPVPDLSSETCRVRVRFAHDPGVASASAAPFSIAATCRLLGLFWIPCPIGPSREDLLRDAIGALEPDFQGDVFRGRDAASLAAALANRDVVIIPLMSSCPSIHLESLGQEVGPVLREFVVDGGVAVLCGLGARNGTLLTGLELAGSVQAFTLPAGAPCDVTSPLHPLAGGVPLRFSSPLGTSGLRLQGGGFEDIALSEGRTVAAAAEVGNGRWVALGFGFEAADPVADRVLANAVRRRPFKPGLRVLAPEPGAVFAPGDTMRIVWAAHDLPAGRVRLAYSAGDVPPEVPFVIGEFPAGERGGEIEWTAPEPEPGKVYSPASIEASLAGAPEVAGRSEGPFFIVRGRLSISTASLPDGYQGAEYRDGIEVEGGVPPHVFEASNLPSGLFLTSPGGVARIGEIAGRPLGTGRDQPVLFRVTDFLGSRAEREIALNIYPSRIEVLSPAAGAFVLAGGAHEVRWRVEGYAGETLRIEYNLDGSPRTFPYVAAESVSPGASFAWTVPSSESSRSIIRIVSNDLPGVSAVSESFAIASVHIACLSPNGAEALETGTLRTIRWRSLGNPGSHVQIDMNLDGSLGSYPVPIAEAVPDTGSYAWLVPRSVSEACRIRVQSTADPGLADVSDDTFAIRWRRPVRCLVWTPYTSFDEIEVRGAIAAATLFENDLDWVLSQALEPEDLRSELAGKEAFLMVQHDPEQEPAGGANFKVPAGKLGPVLREFAERGGAVVVLKQLGSARDFLPASGLLDVVEAGRAIDPSCRVILPDHPVANQVLTEFQPATPAAWYDVRDPRAVVYATTLEGGPVALGKDVGDGRVVVIGFDYRNYTAASARLLANALRYARSEERRRFTRGDANADGVLDVADAIFILLYLYQGGSEPGCLDAADVDDSSQPGHPSPPIGLNDAVVILRWLFIGGDALPPPSPAAPGLTHEDCGPDPQFRDDLDCAEYAPCGG